MSHTNLVNSSTTTASSEELALNPQYIGNANEDPNSSNSYNMYKQENTPFMIIKDEKGWKAALGIHVITPNFEDEKELLNYINEKSWTLIMSVLFATRMIDAEQIKNQTTTTLQENKQTT